MEIDPMEIDSDATIDDLAHLWRVTFYTPASSSDTDAATLLRARLDGLGVLVALRGEVERLIATHAYLAALDGASWSEVGRALGTTKQAAQQRYGGKNQQGFTPEKAREAAHAKRPPFT